MPLLVKRVLGTIVTESTSLVSPTRELEEDTLPVKTASTKLLSVPEEENALSTPALEYREMSMLNKETVETGFSKLEMLPEIEVLYKMLEKVRLPVEELIIKQEETVMEEAVHEGEEVVLNWTEEGRTIER